MTTFGREFRLADLDGSNGFRISGAEANDAAGGSVASAGDVNGDGFADVIVGAINAGSNGAGASYVAFGRAAGFAADLDLSTLDGTNGFRISGEAAAHFAGRWVASAGDINGDGFDDLVIGANSADLNGFDSGASYVVFGRAGGFAANLSLSALDGTNGFRILGDAAGQQVGFPVASAGDINGDGFDDLVIGATGAHADGAAYVMFGRVGGFAASIGLSALIAGGNGFRVTGEAPSGLAGFSAALAGDVNGDGFADLIVGDPATSPNGPASGATYVVFGHALGFGSQLNLATLDGSNGFKLSGEAASDHLGRSVATAGDINGDGFDDLIVGAHGADANGVDSGASYVVFGRARFTANLNMSALDGSNGFRLGGEATGDVSGFSVASAGDLNRDGFADLLVGAYQADANGVISGASYVVFGRAGGFAADLDLSTLDGSTGFRLSGETAADQFGVSVASAGDVNNDGFDDLIIGASRADANGAASGAGYVIFGKATHGSAGNDVLDASGADDDLGGLGGNDIVRGNGGIDTLSGGDGNDQLSGGSANDILAGGSGSDSLDGGAGVDQLLGGAGNDSYVLGAETSGIDSVVDADGADTITSTASRSLAFGAFSEIENLTLLAGTVGTGNALRNTITGNTGANTLNGLGNLDTLAGGGASDTYVVDFTIDTVIEAAGTAAGTADHVVFTGLASQSYVLAANVERLTLSGMAASRGAGNPLNNTLVGNAAGNLFDGRQGNDAIRGQGGSDTIVGGIGIDTLTGGTQSDFFVFNAPLNVAHRDVITDFSNVAGNNDTFRLENAVMTKLGAPGALKATAFFAGTAAHDADDRLVYNKANGALTYDSNGNAAGGATLLAVLATRPTLTAADFVVI